MKKVSAAVGLALLCLGPLAAAPVAATAGLPSGGSDMRRLLDWVIETRDNGRLPFIIIDKRGARLFVFNSQGKAAGTTPVLLGFASGDEAVPGIGLRPLALVRPSERTTPAGRFKTTAGRNLHGEDVIWVDYDAAVSMHRVRATLASERRLERLATPSAADNRISFGCINVPVAFFEKQVAAVFVRGEGVVYVLPEQRSVEMFLQQVEVAQLLRRTRFALRLPQRSWLLGLHEPAPARVQALVRPSAR
jgi:hypothetical protein